MSQVSIIHCQNPLKTFNKIMLVDISFKTNTNMHNQLRVLNYMEIYTKPNKPSHLIDYIYKS